MALVDGVLNRGFLHFLELLIAGDQFQILLAAHARLRQGLASGCNDVFKQELQRAFRGLVGFVRVGGLVDEFALLDEFLQPQAIVVNLLDAPRAGIAERAVGVGHDADGGAREFHVEVVIPVFDVHHARDIRVAACGLRCLADGEVRARLGIGFRLAVGRSAHRELFFVEHTHDLETSVGLRLKLPQFFGLGLWRVVHIDVVFALCIERRAVESGAEERRCAVDFIDFSFLGQHDGRILVVFDLADECTELRGVSSVVFQVVECLLKGVELALRGISHTAGNAVFKDVFGLGDGFLLGREVVGLDVVAGVEDFFLVENLVVRLQTGVETREAALRFGSPGHFAQCQKAREEAIFGLAVRGAGLRPEVHLRADDKALATAHLAVRIEIVDALNTADGAVAVATHIRRVDFQLRGRHLQLVEIVAWRGHENALEAFVGSGSGTSVVPCHDERVDGVGAVPVVDDLVPGHHALAIVLAQEAADGLHEPRLQSIDVAKPFFLNATLAVGVALPGRRGTLVAADVDIVVGEHLGDVAQDAFEEVDGLVLADVQHVGADAARNAHGVGFRWVAAELRICRHDGHHVAGHVDFGDDFDVALLGVGHDFAQVVERVVAAAAVFRIVVERGAVRGVVALHRARADGSHGGQFRIFGNFDAPALVVGQVPVEAVELVDGSCVEQFLHLFLVEEVAAHVEHKSAIRHQRLVGDFNLRKRPVLARFQLFSIDGGRHQLAQRLQGVEESAKIGGLHLNAVARDAERVALRRARVIDREAQMLLRGSFRTVGHRTVDACRAPQVVGQPFGHGLGGLACIDNRRQFVQIKSLSTFHIHRLRIGHERQCGVVERHLVFSDKGHRRVRVARLIELDVVLETHSAPAVEGLTRVREGRNRVVAASRVDFELVERARRFCRPDFRALCGGRCIELQAELVRKRVAVGI